MGWHPVESVESGSVDGAWDGLPCSTQTSISTDKGLFEWNPEEAYLEAYSECIMILYRLLYHTLAGTVSLMWRLRSVYSRTTGIK